MFHFATLAFLVCVHWPPLIADASDAPHFWHHALVSLLVAAFLFVIGETTPKKSSRVAGELAGAGISNDGGVSWGNREVIRFMRHLLTEAWTAEVKSFGESSPNVSLRPLSSSTVLSFNQVHFKRAAVATIAVAGPVTLPHKDFPTMFNLVLASRMAFSSIGTGNHVSQKANAQYLKGPACASKAGSADPQLPSAAAHTKSMFLPAAFAEHALAAATLILWSAAQLMPMHSTAYSTDAAATALTIWCTLAPASRKAPNVATLLRNC